MEKIGQGKLPDLLELEVVTGPVAGVKFDKCKRRMKVGRERSDITIKDEEISSKHGIIEWDGQRWNFQDVGSRNGSKLNGALLAEKVWYPLCSGDVIEMGLSTKVAVVITPAAVPTDEVTVQQYVEMEVARLSQKLTAVGAAGKQAVRQKGIEAKRTILESLNR